MNDQVEHWNHRHQPVIHDHSFHVIHDLNKTTIFFNYSRENSNLKDWRNDPLLHRHHHHLSFDILNESIRSLPLSLPPPLT